MSRRCIKITAITDGKITVLWNKDQKSNTLILVINGSIETCSGSALGKVTGLEVLLFPALSSSPHSFVCSPGLITQPQGQPQALAPAWFGHCCSSQAPSPLLEAPRSRVGGSVCVQCSSPRGWKPPPTTAKVFPVLAHAPPPQPRAVSTLLVRAAAQSSAEPPADPSPPPVQPPSSPPSSHCSATARLRPHFPAEMLPCPLQVC